MSFVLNKRKHILSVGDLLCVQLAEMGLTSVGAGSFRRKEEVSVVILGRGLRQTNAPIWEYIVDAI